MIVELQIIDEQLDHIARLSREQLLDLPTVKQFDMLVKLKQLLSERPTDHIKTTTNAANNLTDDDLITTLRSIKRG